MRFVALFLWILPMVLTSPLVVERQASNLPNPHNDTFYDAPANLNSFKEGDIIRQRQVDVSLDSPSLDSSYQLLYYTHNTQRQDDATVATVLLPKKPASPPRILSVQIYEDSVQFDCAPSWAISKGSKSPGVFSTNFLDTPIYMAWALSQGYYVVAADHEGKKAAFIAGQEAGMRVLDGVRALVNFSKLSNAQVAFAGYSGGAHATAWAVNLAGSYAPELNVVGASYGGTPVDTRGSFNFIDGGLFAGFAGAGVIGVSRAYPELAEFIDQHLTEKGRAAIAKFDQSGYCIGSVATGFPFAQLTSYFNLSDPLDQPISRAILKKETLLKAVSSSPDSISVPKFPRYIFHSLLDEIIPYKDAKSYVKEQCSEGANIHFGTYPVSEHVTGLIFGIVPTVAFLKAAFEGKATYVKCGTSLPNLPNLFDPEAKDLIGEDNVKMLLSLNNTKSPFGETVRL